MTNQSPITSYEVIHDYRLLEPTKQNNFSDGRTGRTPMYIAALVLAGLALALSICALVLVLINSPFALVPGTFQNATVVVDAKGRVVSVSPGVSPHSVTFTPPGAQVAQTSPPEPTTRLPWSKSASSKVGAREPETTLHAELPRSADSPVPIEANPPKVVENFVKFQTVQFKEGLVSTGWRYADSEATEPAEQWCYYKIHDTENKGLAPTLSLDEDVAEAESMRKVGLTFSEYVDARSKCKWYNNSEPQSSHVPGKTY